MNLIVIVKVLSSKFRSLSETQTHNIKFQQNRSEGNISAKVCWFDKSVLNLTSHRQWCIWLIFWKSADTVNSPKKCYEWVLGESHLTRFRRSMKFLFQSRLINAAFGWLHHLHNTHDLYHMHYQHDVHDLYHMHHLHMHKPVVFKRMNCVRLPSFDNASNQLGRIRRWWWSSSWVKQLFFLTFRQKLATICLLLKNDVVRYVVNQYVAIAASDSLAKISQFSFLPLWWS